MENKNFYKKIFSSCGNDSENNNSTTKPTANMWDSGTKRKVETEPESPRKKLKGAREASEMLSEEVVTIGTKRKNTEQDPPCKKLRSGEQEATSSSCSSSQPVRATKKKAQIDKSSDTARPEEVILIESSSSSDYGLVIDEDISENNSSTTKPTANTWDSGTKRTARTGPESPRKKLKGAREPSESIVIISTKRKNTEQDPPCKKLRSGKQEATSSGCSSSQPVRATKKKAQIDKSSDTARPEEVILIESSSDSGLVVDKDISGVVIPTEKSSNTSKPAEATERRTVYEVDVVVSGGLNGNYTFTSAPINSLVGSDGEVMVNTVKEDTEAAEEDVTDDFEEKYLLLQKLGQGGFGSVYAGIRKTDKRPVAIKRVQKAVKRKPMIVNGRMRMVPIEVYLMLKATDGQDSETKSAPVALLDWYDRKGEVIVVMERPVPCMDLWNYLLKNRGSLEEDLVKNIMKQLVDAAKEMHSRGILHRDLKLENLLIESSSDGPRVRIIDFGCGCIARRKPYSTFSGTVSYVPPEMWRMGMYKAGPTTVWQLGAILFEMVDGCKRFNTLNFCRFGLKISSKLSEDCQDFLKMCLFKNPDKRATLDQLQQHRWFR